MKRKHLVERNEKETAPIYVFFLYVSSSSSHSWMDYMKFYRTYRTAIAHIWNAAPFYSMRTYIHTHTHVHIREILQKDHK